MGNILVTKSNQIKYAKAKNIRRYSDIMSVPYMLMSLKENKQLKDKSIQKWAKMKLKLTQQLLATKPRQPNIQEHRHLVRYCDKLMILIRYLKLSEKREKIRNKRKTGD